MRAAAIALLLATPLVEGQTDSGAWRMYGRNSLGWRYSELTQIDAGNVARLTPRWIYQTGVGGGFETTPLVFDGLMFIAGPSNNSWALDALTGRPVWHQKKTPPTRLNLCCGEVNRGFAVHGDRLFRVNIEGTLVALVGGAAGLLIAHYSGAPALQRLSAVLLALGFAATVGVLPFLQELAPDE